MRRQRGQLAQASGWEWAWGRGKVVVTVASSSKRRAWQKQVLMRRERRARAPGRNGLRGA